MSEILRLAVAVPYALDTAPSQRFRWEQWAPRLANHGIQVEFVPFGTQAFQSARARGENRRAARLALQRLPAWSLELVSRFAAADIRVVHRNAAIELLASRSRTPLVYDFDDAIYLAPETGDTLLKRTIRCDWRVSAISRRADLVVGGNEGLAEYARQFTRHTAVWPTTIALQDYSARQYEVLSSPPVIGWSGSASTGQYLEQLLPTLREVRRIQPFKLLVIGAKISDTHGLDVECRPWTPETEVANLQQMDIGVMPLPDSPWTRGKCALKALQYLGVGVPAVVADVGPNALAVPNGTAGYSASSTGEWVEALVSLLADPAKRRTMGANGRRHVRDHYSAEAWAPKIAEQLRALHERAGN